MPRVEPSRPRIGLWITACALCAAAGFWAGRHPFAAAPAHASADSPSARQTASGPARGTRPGTTSATSEASASDDAHTAARRTVLIDLLQRLSSPDGSQNIGAMIKLAAWMENTDEDGLAEALALGAEIADATKDTKEKRHSPLNEFLPFLVFNRWAAIDGSAALEAYLDLPEGQRSSHTATALFKSWTSEGDPQDAFDHALALRRTMSDDESIGGIELDEILNDWNRRDPAAALAAARDLAASTDEEERSAARDLAGKISVTAMQERGADDALRWIDQWPDAAGRDELRIQLLHRLDPDNEADRETSARIIASIQSTETFTRSSYIHNYVQRLAGKDLDAARRWTATLPPAARASTVGIISGQLAQTGDWREAVAWVDAQTTDTETRSLTYREAALAAAGQGDLAAAVSLADRTTDGSDPDSNQFRSRAQHVAILEAWMRSDPARREQLFLHALTLDAASPTASPTAASNDR